MAAFGLELSPLRLVLDDQVIVSRAFHWRLVIQTYILQSYEPPWHQGDQAGHP